MAAEAKSVDINSVMSLPEVQMAVKQAAAKAAAEAVQDVLKAGKGSATLSDATEQLLSQLAVGIAELSFQGSGRARPLAPDVIAKREAADKKCRELLRAAIERGEKPEYRVMAKIYFGERLIEPYRREGGRNGQVVAQEIIWTGMPNDALWPINKIAENIYSLYRESVGSPPRLNKITYKDGRGGVGVVAPDNRGMSMTPGGLVVKGEINPHQVIGPAKPIDEFHDNNDPNASEVRILGTVAAPARRNFNDGTNSQVQSR